MYETDGRRWRTSQVQSPEVLFTSQTSEVTQSQLTLKCPRFAALQSITGRSRLVARLTIDTPATQPRVLGDQRRMRLNDNRNRSGHEAVLFSATPPPPPPPPPPPAPNPPRKNAVKLFTSSTKVLNRKESCCRTKDKLYKLWWRGGGWEERGVWRGVGGWGGDSTTTTTTTTTKTSLGFLPMYSSSGQSR